VSKPVLALLAAVAAIAMIAAGCGSSDDDSSALTKAEFVKQGNAICAKGNKEIEGEFEGFAKEHNLSGDKEPSKEVLGEAAEDIVIPSVNVQVEELRELEAPSGEEDQVDEILTAAEEALETGEEDPVALTNEDEDPFAKANKLAQDYGLARCGEE